MGPRFFSQSDLMENAKVILAGGSGFLGRSLAEVLAARGYRVVVLTRSPSIDTARIAEEVFWDGKTVGDWAHSLNGAAAVVNSDRAHELFSRWHGRKRTPIHQLAASGRLESDVSMGNRARGNCRRLQRDQPEPGAERHLHVRTAADITSAVESAGARLGSPCRFVVHANGAVPRFDRATLHPSAFSGPRV